MALADQIVQSNHAILTLATTASPHYSFNFNPPSKHNYPNIILIGVPDRRALDRVQKKLALNSIPHYCWTEPDNNLGFTAIATIPLRPDEKIPLANYRLWRPVYSPVAQLQSAPAAHKAAGDMVVQPHPGEPISISAISSTG